MSPDQEPNPGQGSAEEHNPLFENPEFLRKAHGNPELLELLVRSDELMQEGVQMSREKGKIPEEHRERVREVMSDIREKKESLGLDRYE